MLRPTALFIVFGVTIALYVAFTTRVEWINRKIAALSSPPSSSFALANAKVPPKGAKARIVLIGDSRVARWPLGALAERWDVINRGVGGETTTQLAARFYVDAIALDPDLIIIESGVNDLVAASFMDDASKELVAHKTADTLRQLAQQAAESGHRILIATIIPAARPEILRLLVWKESLRDLIEQVNTELRQSHFPDRTDLIDFSSMLISNDDNRRMSNDYRLDTLHVNKAGYEHLTKMLEQYLQSTLNSSR